MKPNAIANAIAYTKRYIPLEVLELAFKDSDPYLNKYADIDSKIRTKVVEPVVKIDINCNGGKNISVRLDSCSILRPDNTINLFVITVPKHLTNYRSIIAVNNIMQAYTPTLIGSKMMLGSTNPLTRAVSNTMNALDTAKIITTSRISIIGDNVILVEEPANLLQSGLLNCDIEYDENLEDIQPRYQKVIGELLLNATKNFIYNTLVVKIDKGRIYGGHELGTIADIINGYSDAGEEYKRILKEEWPKVSVLNDKRRMHKFLMLLNGVNT